MGNTIVQVSHTLQKKGQGEELYPNNLGLALAKAEVQIPFWFLNYLQTKLRLATLKLFATCMLVTLHTATQGS